MSSCLKTSSETPPSGPIFSGDCLDISIETYHIINLPEMFALFFWLISLQFYLLLVSFHCFLSWPGIIMLPLSQLVFSDHFVSFLLIYIAKLVAKSF